MALNLQNIVSPIETSFRDVIGYAATYIPSIIVAIIIVVVGWIIGTIVGRLVEQLISSLKFIDESVKSVGLAGTFSQAGMNLNIGRFFGVLVQVFIIIVFVVAAFDVLSLDIINVYLTNTVLGYIPNVFVAAVILIITALIARFIGNFVSGSAKLTKVGAGSFAGEVAKSAIWVFGIIAALQQLQVAQAVLGSIVNGIIIAVSIALGLAFGFGGQQVAADYLDRLRNKIK